MDKKTKKLVAILISAIISVTVSAIGCSLGIPAHDLLPTDIAISQCIDA